MEPVHVSFFLHKLWLKAPEEASFLCVSLVYRDQGPCFQFLHLFRHALLFSPLAISILCVKVGVSLLSFQCDRFCASFLLDWMLCVHLLRPIMWVLLNPQYLGSSLDFDSSGFYVGGSHVARLPLLSFS